MNITVNTNLNGFRLIDKIINISYDSIIASKINRVDEPYLILESFAQLAALHVRYRINYKKHAFLLKVNNFSNNYNMDINDNYSIRGGIISSSDTSFLYKITASNNGSIVSESKLIISTVEYDKFFQKKFLEKYYKNLIKCLMKE